MPQHALKTWRRILFPRLDDVTTFHRHAAPPAAPGPVPTQRRFELHPRHRTCELTNLKDHVTHRLLRTAYDIARRHADGGYRAVCGALVVPSVLTDPGVRNCPDCAERTF